MSNTESYSSEWKWLLASFKKPGAEVVEKESKRIHSVAIVLSLFLGWTGLDRFYLGKVGTGILKMVTFGGLGVWWLIDLFMLVGPRASQDVNGNPLKEEDSKLSFTYLFLTIFASAFGLHYYYLGFKRLAFTRLGVFLLYFIALWWCWSSLVSYHPSGTANFVSSILIFILFVWGLVDLYLVVTGKITSDAQGNALQTNGHKYQSLCLLFALFCGVFGFDRFYLGHRVLGLLKLFTFGGFLSWYVLDIVLAILNAQKDSNGNALVQE